MKSFMKNQAPPSKVSKEEKEYVQQVVGGFFIYARAIDMAILLTLSAIASEQANLTKETMKRVRQLLDFMASHPQAVI